MNVLDYLRRERALWKEYPWDRARWLVKHRRGFLTGRKFRAGAVDYEYFVHPYNQTWVNERTVEIPLVLGHVGAWNRPDTLELGNVLSHYFNTVHTVVDKYENATFRQTVNEDILDLDLGRRFPLIISISTIEHVGWDETPREPARVLRVFPKVESMLAPGGKAVITVPIGYNPVLDGALRDICERAEKVVCVQRVSQANEWREATLDAALACRYGDPFHNANAVVLLVMRQGGSPAASASR